MHDNQKMDLALRETGRSGVVETLTASIAGRLRRWMLREFLRPAPTRNHARFGKLEICETRSARFGKLENWKIVNQAEKGLRTAAGGCDRLIRWCSRRTRCSPWKKIAMISAGSWIDEDDCQLPWMLDSVAWCRDSWQSPWFWQQRGQRDKGRQITKWLWAWWLRNRCFLVVLEKSEGTV